MGERPTLIIGEEEFLAEEALGRLLDRLLPGEERALNLDVLEATAPVGELLVRLQTAPFFGPRRVVVVRRLEAMRDADQERLAAHLDAAGEAPTAAIFVARELDRRRRLFQVFTRRAEIVECRPLPPRELPRWVAERFRAVGKRAGPGAAEQLVALAGSGLRDLAHEVEKVAAYAGDRAIVTPADVTAIASRLGEASVFTLVDAVGNGEMATALRALHDNLATHEPLQVLFMIARQFRLILRAHHLVARGGGAAVADRLGVPPFVARKVAEQARRFRAGQFPGIFAALEDADRTIKSGSPARLVLETLIVRLCGGERRAAVGRRGR
ncbi:MAG: DNA polymerase III subunit delta [Armatimonadota bacterium]|nr:DNA polymerase III subunit delta [Armatimonadota bacterium]MDR7534015.1 DNA polymerase III subunit delta [Armatimonadota bacterium]MDR7536546.1 DNA polymerase III subunit delta [Armatimonadota bacterium]